MPWLLLTSARADWPSCVAVAAVGVVELFVVVDWVDWVDWAI